jgi:hypothetical protein
MLGWIGKPNQAGRTMPWLYCVSKNVSHALLSVWRRGSTRPGINHQGEVSLMK